MHKFIGCNGKITLADDASLPAISSAAFYGRGVFTTLAIYNRNPFLLNEHLRRLKSNAEQINLETAQISLAEQTLSELISANKIETGRARITLFDVAGSAVWNFSAEEKTAILIVTGERKKTNNRINLGVSPYLLNSTSPLAGIKSCNYLENLLAFERAKKEGCDEAIRLNERRAAVSACLANLFWAKNERIFTPALATGALAGTTRGLVFDLAKNLEVETIETISDLNALETADEIFLTSAGIEICSVAKFGERIYGNSLAGKLRKAFRDFAEIN